MVLEWILKNFFFLDHFYDQTFQKLSANFFSPTIRADQKRANFFAVLGLHGNVITDNKKSLRLLPSRLRHLRQVLTLGHLRLSGMAVLLGVTTRLATGAYSTPYHPLPQGHTTRLFKSRQRYKHVSCNPCNTILPDSSPSAAYCPIRLAKQHKLT